VEAVLAQQTRVFLWAAITGLCLGGVYDFFCGVRRLLRAGKALTALCDILFCLTALLVFVLFMLTRGQGEIRGYIPGGMLIGSVLYFCALSDAVLALLLPLLRLVQKLLQAAAHLLRLAFVMPRGS